MRLVTRFLIAVLAFNLVFAPASLFAYAEDEPREGATDSTEVAEGVNSYELFWPIVAGKVMGEPLYFLKSLKETIRELFIFSSFKRADYNITLSEKRTVEAEKVYLEKQDYENGRKTLVAAQVRREKALENINKAQAEGQDTNPLKDRFADSLEKQKLLLSYIADQVTEEQKSGVEENIADINSILDKLQ